MDAHALAIAALEEVAHPTTHRRETFPGVAISGPNATGSYRTTNKAVHDNASNAQNPSRTMIGTGGTSTNMGGSQESQNSTIQSASDNNSQSTTDGHDTASTPPSDGFSSQSTNQDGHLSQLSQLSQLAAAAHPMANTSASRQSLPNAPTAGHKRTADGQVKPPTPPSPHVQPVRGHSRNTSAVSNVSSATSSRIGELSSELRTRLSYAMVKVNNGWQSNTIDEVETLASQAGSPTSSTSTIQRLHRIASPRDAIASIQSNTSVPVNPTTQAPTGDFDLYSRAEPGQMTYESFWRGHSAIVPSQRAPQVPSPPSSKVALQPPADIRPQPISRRSHTPKFSKPPTISGQGSNSSHTSSHPRTPPLQNPNQKTIQEQDAIETLLFMSSPGNSANMGNQFPAPRPSQTSPQNSPLRAEFSLQDRARGAQGRRVGFEKSVASPIRPGERSYAQRSKLAAVGAKRRGDAIDKMLDEMRDSSSDDEEVVLTNYSSPRRLAAGRV